MAWVAVSSILSSGRGNKNPIFLIVESHPCLVVDEAKEKTNPSGRSKTESRLPFLNQPNIIRHDSYYPSGPGVDHLLRRRIRLEDDPMGRVSSLIPFLQVRSVPHQRFSDQTQHVIG